MMPLPPSVQWPFNEKPRTHRSLDTNNIMYISSRFWGSLSWTCTSHLIMAVTFLSSKEASLKIGAQVDDRFLLSEI